MIRPDLIKPGLFSTTVAADTRRGVFDIQNESLLAEQCPIDAVFIGDSITEMWALDAYFKGASGLLVNRGIGGDISTYVRKRFNADVLQLSPRLVVLAVGVNDLWELDLIANPLAMQQAADDIERGIINDIYSMIRHAAAGQNINVALCSLLPTNIPFNGNNAFRNESILRINAQLEKLANQYELVTYVDYHSHLVADDGRTLRDGLADDGLHPHSTGYQIMASVLLNTLEEAGIKRIRPRS